MNLLLVNAAGQVFLAPESIAAIAGAVGGIDEHVDCHRREASNQRHIQQLADDNRRLRNAMISLREDVERLKHRLAQRDAQIQRLDPDGALYDSAYAADRTEDGGG